MEEGQSFYLGIRRTDCRFEHIGLVLLMNDQLELDYVYHAIFSPTNDCPPLEVDGELVELECSLSSTSNIRIEASASMDRVSIHFDDLSVHCGLPEDAPAPRLRTVHIQGTYSAPLEHLETVCPV